ncbi:MAG: hypothetical protein PF689_13035 [Deltaproteobacteria bacterium]|nr:hypothetical protein [Deltaproteobacteria bacterium]
MSILLFFLIILFSGCDSQSCPESDCSPNYCSGHGSCHVTNRGDSYCVCDKNYRSRAEFICAYVPDTNNTKPIIYLYPQEKSWIQVAFSEPENIELTHTYPVYPEGGWEVIASPDGTLEDPLTKRMYYALYWEGITNLKIFVDTGFVVKGEDIIGFLEEKLEKLGLNSIEANEFIIYWLPILEANPYNLIHFATSEWEEVAKLRVTPEPDTVIRFSMLYKEVDEKFEITEQQLSPRPERTGFVLVEWGGRELPDELAGGN